MAHTLAPSLMRYFNAHHRLGGTVRVSPQLGISDFGWTTFRNFHVFIIRDNG